ncbi:hypothetical protein BKA63DRAFT_539914 [Paraphoma chrysanthemicola]|nr:hypothetical protein BKA63DRAFT_539914 [Paraphoma chrysanthemicola]
MANLSPSECRPFITNVFSDEVASVDILPALYHYSEGNGVHKRRRVGDPTRDIPHFLRTELSVGELDNILKHLWFAGVRRPPTQLHHQIAMGRQIALVDRLDLHLVWADNGTLYVKALPRFILEPSFWKTHLECLPGCECQLPGQKSTAMATCMKEPRQAALGLLYSYTCLVSSESDYFVAIEKHLLPLETDGSTITWKRWKELARELHKNVRLCDVHARFHRGELRLSRLNAINRITNVSLFRPYLRSWHNYSTYFRDNLTWVATATIFAAFVLTAMQVGLATERLGKNTGFQRASYGFTVFSLVGPICFVLLMALIAVVNLFVDLPGLLSDGEKALTDT